MRKKALENANTLEDASRECLRKPQLPHRLTTNKILMLVVYSCIQLHDAQDLHDASTSSKWPKIKSKFDGTMIPDYGASSEPGYKESLEPFPSMSKPLDLSLGYMYPSKPMRIQQMSSTELTDATQSKAGAKKWRSILK